MSNKGKRRVKKALDIYVTTMIPMDLYVEEAEYRVFAGHAERAAVFAGEQEEILKQGLFYFIVEVYNGRKMEQIYSSRKLHIDPMDKSTLELIASV